MRRFHPRSLLLAAFGLSVLLHTLPDSDHDHVFEKKRDIDDRGDSIIVNKHYLFVRDKVMGDYYFSYRENGDITATTRAFDRRAKDHKPLAFNFSASGTHYLYDTIPDNKNTSMVRYEGTINQP